MANQIDENNSQEDSLLLGIDGGGTKCKAVLMDQNNNILGIGMSGPGNPIYGLEIAQKSIVESAALALKNASEKHEDLRKVGLNNITAGIGLAGVNVPQMYKLMTKWKSPFKSKYLTTDLFIACLGAHNGNDGAVMICGTGSCGFSYVNGSSKVVGSHGFPQGDKCSGAWFGLKAVEAVLLSLDKMAKTTSITHHLLKSLNVDSADGIVEKVASKTSSTFAGLAHTVFCATKEGDEVALSILEEGAKYINDMAKLLNQTSPPSISFIGGMAKSITPFLDKSLINKLRPPLYPPEVGAVLYARQQIAATRILDNTNENLK